LALVEARSRAVDCYRLRRRTPLSGGLGASSRTIQENENENVRNVLRRQRAAQEGSRVSVLRMARASALYAYLERHRHEWRFLIDDAELAGWTRKQLEDAIDDLAAHGAIELSSVRGGLAICLRLFPKPSGETNRI
jgi:hypothetical protein